MFSRDKIFIVLAVLTAVGAKALYVSDGEQYSDDGYLIISDSSHDNELLVGGDVVAEGLVIGDGSYDSLAWIHGGSVTSDLIYLGSSSRGCSMLIEEGGVVSASSFNLYGGGTLGVPYSSLRNSITLSGLGSALNVSGHMKIWSPKNQGQPGEYDKLREIPAFMNVSDGARVEVGSLSITNGSWIEIGSGGSLHIETDLNASEGNIYHGSGGLLSVGGELRGVSYVGVGSMLEAPFVKGNLTVDGEFSVGNATNSFVDGNLIITESGVLEIRSDSQLTVTGSTVFEGELKVHFDEFSGPEVGASIQLFNIQGEVSGSFDSISPLGGDTLEWDASDLYTTGALRVIPEPTVLSLLALSGGLTIIYRRMTGRRLADF